MTTLPSFCEIRLPGRVHRTCKANWTKLGKRPQHKSALCSLLPSKYEAATTDGAPYPAQLSELGLYNAGVDTATCLQVPTTYLLWEFPSHLLHLCAFLFHKTVEQLRLEET